MKKLTTEEFIQKAKLIHGDKYDYSLSMYNGSNNKIEINCHLHGKFYQQSGAHLNGQGCKKCGRIKSANTQRLLTKDFILKSNIIHDNFYNYSLVNYTNLDNDVKISCPTHGIFKQRASRHLKGSICPRCNNIKSRINQKHDEKDFVLKAKNVHGDLFDYSKVIYINNKTKVEIICKKHGPWWQTPVNHITNKRKCPLCNESKGEDVISQFLLNNNILFERQKRFEECKDIRKLPFDFYLPIYNICIEYNGIHHYKPVAYFGGLNTTKEQQKRDKIKIIFCINNKIQLLIIKYTENIEKTLIEYFTNYNLVGS